MKKYTNKILITGIVTFLAFAIIFFFVKTSEVKNRINSTTNELIINH